MIISRTPLRISFFGGGTDYPQWAGRHGGAVISTSIDKYIYHIARPLPPFFDHRHRLSYSRVEHVNSVSEIIHPAMKAILKDYDPPENQGGLEINCNADLPARSGLGSSSAFIVGLLNVLNALQGQPASRQWLAEEAIRYETFILKENIGFQDQIATAYGGLNRIDFHPDGGFSVKKLELAPGRQRELSERLILFFTGFSRNADEVAQDQIARIDANFLFLQNIRTMVDQGLDILTGPGDLRPFGELLNEAWMIKRKLSERVSNPKLDEIYRAAINKGATGGKLLGAGGGGFFLFFVEPENRKRLISSLKPLLEIPFSFESCGSQIIYNAEDVAL